MQRKGHAHVRHHEPGHLPHPRRVAGDPGAGNRHLHAHYTCIVCVCIYIYIYTQIIIYTLPLSRQTAWHSLPSTLKRLYAYMHIKHVHLLISIIIIHIYIYIYMYIYTHIYIYVIFSICAVRGDRPGNPRDHPGPQDGGSECLWESRSKMIWVGMPMLIRVFWISGCLWI